MRNMNEIVATHNLLFVTFDTLRYDVAVAAYADGQTPNLAGLFPDNWEKRHSPGSFTYAAHQAFFAGFLPSPARPGKHARLFACDFAGSETTAGSTFVCPTANIVDGLARVGFHTICVGGVGFFNKQDPLGKVLPGLFNHSVWEPALGVTEKESSRNQFTSAASCLATLPPGQRFFLFINLSAFHQPNHFYLEGAEQDSPASMALALAYVDSQLPILMTAVRARGKCFSVFCSDHGTAYGEDGYAGHRLAHEVTWTVPYRDFVVEGS